MFVSQEIFYTIFLAIQEIEPVSTLNKAMCVELNGLDLSKYLMYKFHYKYMNAKYGSNANFLFTGTGSLVYEIETDDV